MNKFKLLASLVGGDSGFNLAWDKSNSGDDANYYIVDKSDVENEVPLVTIFVKDDVIGYAFRHPTGYVHWDRISDMIVEFLKSTKHRAIDRVALEDLELDDNQRDEVFRSNSDLEFIDLGPDG